MRRIALLFGLGLILSGVAFAGYGPTTASGSVTHKQSCKTVTKKVHGKKKKVRVCHEVKAKPTATRTRIPTATPTATATSTATETPVPPTPTSTPTLTLAQRFRVSHDANGAVYVDDTVTGMQAAALRVETGNTEVLGTDFSILGLTAVFVYVQERNISFTGDNGAGPGTYRVGGDFSLKPGGQVSCCGPADQQYDPVSAPRLIQGDVTQGWMTFNVPLGSGDYTLSWRENLTDEIRHDVPMMQIHVP
jgi:hypothetical protein